MQKPSSNRDFRQFSPTDFRYGVDDLIPFLSEEAYVKYKARVEGALAFQLSKEGICSRSVAREISKACETVDPEEVYEEEVRIKHDVRALVNVIRRKVSRKARPFVHLTATSYDIVDTANALRFKDAINSVVLKDLIKLDIALIKISKKYAKAVQAGRTHGQHAEPITFGFFLSYYVSRLGKRIIKLEDATENLTGKFAGAVGAYGPLTLLVNDPEKFEYELLRSLGLKPSEVSTQIVQPEAMTDLMNCLISAFGVMANLSRDLRNLQRTEIDEVSEEFSSKQVGSSTMPQKRNPISFENIEGLWKKSVPQMITVYLDQVSEHQRDLTGSSSQRYLPEMVVLFDYCVRRLTSTIWDERDDRPKIGINIEKMRSNLEDSLDKMAAEPLYILLSSSGHHDAHERVRQIVQRSIETGISFRSEVLSDPQLKTYFRAFGSKLKFVEHPELYVGLAPEKALEVANKWEKVFRRKSFKRDHR